MNSAANTRATLIIGACLAAFLLAGGSAAARATSKRTWGVKPKTYRQYVQLCKHRPHLPACRSARFYFGKLKKKAKLSASQRFRYKARLHRTRVKARRQKMRRLARRNRKRNLWRRLWRRTRHRALALRAMWFGKRKTRAAVRPPSPFHSSGGFGHYVQRSHRASRVSWVYKRGRLGLRRPPSRSFKPRPRPRRPKRLNLFERRKKKMEKAQHQARMRALRKAQKKAQEKKR